MSAPSTAHFFTVHENGEREHLGHIFCNCGWFFHEEHFLADIADDIERSEILNGTMKKGVEWDYVIAYGMAWSKETVMSHLPELAPRRGE
ncbi:UNVERIFIED_ORG: hypothetical protein GCAPEGMB_00258 [Vibrio phage V07]|nr:hypothetical protein pp2_217 [Vibrio phage phi-pp2]